MPERARARVEEIQRNLLRQLGSPVPDAPPPPGTDYRVRYAASDPEHADPEHPESVLPPGSRPDIGSYGGSSNILVPLVDSLRSVVGVDPLADVCFGTIPGGGLDAYSELVTDANEYLVVVPEGLFSLIHLFARIVVMLQPLDTGPSGLSYPADAARAQLDLAGSPQVRFRESDVLAAYFVHGDPDAALPHARALPHEGRFDYVIEAAELYVLAHEAAHVVLRHLDGGTAIVARQELQADRFALDVVTRHLEREYPQARTRAQIGGLLFHGLNAMWEKVVVAALGEDVVGLTSGHPPAQERMRSYLNSCVTDDEAPWARYVYSAVGLATGAIAEDCAAEVIRRADTLGGLSARVAPRDLAHLLRPTMVDPVAQWMRTIVRLLSSTPVDRRIGLWFVQEYSPMVAVAMYEGLDDDDPEWQASCARALTSVEPLYESYLPTLREMLRSVEEDDDLGLYQLRISSWMTAKVRGELGEHRIAVGPSHPDFYRT